MSRQHDVRIEERGRGGVTMNERLYMNMSWMEVGVGVGQSELDAERAGGSSSSALPFPTESPFGAAALEDKLAQFLKEKNVEFVIYDDTQHPSRFGLLTWSVDPSDFVTKKRPALDAFMAAQPKGTLKIVTTMFGKTYSNGHEPDLDFTLLKKPVKVASAEENCWAVWYPLKRKGKFYSLDPSKMCELLLEHALIGRCYGEKNLAHDVRLNCYGLDTEDNEFVVGIIGKELHPLSKVIQDMRKTDHTSEYMDRLGPFYVGYRRSQNVLGLPGKAVKVAEEGDQAYNATEAAKVYDPANSAGEGESAKGAGKGGKGKA